MFLRELGNVNWVEGVEVVTNKEECRKIHGYTKGLKKKRFNLFGGGQVPRQMRMD